MNQNRFAFGVCLLAVGLGLTAPASAEAVPPERRAAIPTYATNLFTGYATGENAPPQGVPLHGPVAYKGEIFSLPQLACKFDDPVYRGHRGADFPADSGAPVYATLSGLVVWAGERRGGWGQLVVVENNGWQTWFAHLSAVGVHRGALVNTGEVIGAVGTTGHSTAPHLHYGIMQLNSTPGSAPALWRNPEGFWGSEAVTHRPCW